MTPQDRIKTLSDGIRTADSALDALTFPADELVKLGATCNFSGGTYQCRWHGVSASATAGSRQAIGAWINAARRRIDRITEEFSLADRDAYDRWILERGGQA